MIPENISDLNLTSNSKQKPVDHYRLTDFLFYLGHFNGW